jgi:hypothetical protein
MWKYYLRDSGASEINRKVVKPETEVLETLAELLWNSDAECTACHHDSDVGTTLLLCSAL